MSGPPLHKRYPKAFWTVFGVVGLLAVVSVGGALSSSPESTATPGASRTTTETQTETATETETETETETATQLAGATGPTIPGDGSFEVGVDIKPGKYKSPKPGSGNCYWARLRDEDNSLNSIIDNNNSSGPSVVTIKRTDKVFETSGCNDWVKVR